MHPLLWNAWHTVVVPSLWNCAASTVIHQVSGGVFEEGHSVGWSSRRLGRVRARGTVSEEQIPPAGGAVCAQELKAHRVGLCLPGNCEEPASHRAPRIALRSTHRGLADSQPPQGWASVSASQDPDVGSQALTSVLEFPLG